MDKFSAFDAELDFLRDQNRRKSAGYAGSSNPDPWSNFRLSSEFGVEPYLGVAVRLSDKFSRLTALLRDPSNDQVSESLGDTLRDLAAYALILKILFEEASVSGDSVEEVSGVPAVSPLDPTGGIPSGTDFQFGLPVAVLDVEFPPCGSITRHYGCNESHRERTIKEYMDGISIG